MEEVTMGEGVIEQRKKALLQHALTSCGQNDGMSTVERHVCIELALDALNQEKANDEFYFAALASLRDDINMLGIEDTCARYGIPIGGTQRTV